MKMRLNQTVFCYLLTFSLIFVPILITSFSIPTVREKVDIADHPTPHGYTISLGIYLIPAFILGITLFRSAVNFDRLAALKTILVLPLIGYGLDLALGTAFFTFENRPATLGLWVPGYDWDLHSFQSNLLPLEEFIFYTGGVACMVGVYLWIDLFWFNRYHVGERVVEQRGITTVADPDWRFAYAGLAMVLLALLVKKFGAHANHQGFPGYFAFIVMSFLIPCSMFFRAAHPLINWRALSLTMLFCLLIDVAWEATLAYPNLWCNYRIEEMIGITVPSWSGLPIEELLLWLSGPPLVVLCYETARVQHALIKQKRSQKLVTLDLPRIMLPNLKINHEPMT